MNNIEILNIFCENPIGVNYHEIKEAIENLIQENKELKEMLKRRIAYTRELEEDLFENSTNYVIPKSKVKEKIEELDKKKRKSQIEYSTIDELIFDKKIEVLQKLLEE